MPSKMPMQVFSKKESFTLDQLMGEVAEYDEPNHEAEALEAIIQLSRKNKPEKQDG